MGSRTSKEEDSSTSYRALPTSESSTKFQAVVVDAKDATKKVAEPVSIRIVEPNTSNQGTICAICRGAATKNIVFVVGDFPPPELPYCAACTPSAKASEVAYYASRNFLPLGDASALITKDTTLIVKHANGNFNTNLKPLCWHIYDRKEFIDLWETVAHRGTFPFKREGEHVLILKMDRGFQNRLANVLVEELAQENGWMRRTANAGAMFPPPFPNGYPTDKRQAFERAFADFITWLGCAQL